MMKTAPINSNYSKYANIAAYNFPKTNERLWATKSDYSTSFEIGPTNYLFGPNAKISQEYIADLLSNAVNWDLFCESCTTNNNFIKSNSADILPVSKYTPQNLTIGQCNIYNAACRSFADLTDFNITQQHFNPNDNHSSIVNSYKLIPFHTPRMYVPPEPNNNILLNKILDNPEIYLNLLLNMKANTTSQQMQTLKGTRIYNCFAKIDAFQRMNN